MNKEQLKLINEAEKSIQDILNKLEASAGIQVVNMSIQSINVTHLGSLAEEYRRRVVIGVRAHQDSSIDGYSDD